MENEPDDTPRYALRLLPTASRSIDLAAAYVADTSGRDGDDASEYAIFWRQGLDVAIATLATLPLRFAVAPEADVLAPPPVHALLYRHNQSGPTWRVLYRVRDADDNDSARVEIVTIRHGAQKPLTRKEGRDLDAANG